MVEAAKDYPNFKPIRDESCNLKNCPGPVSRGRNVAIAAASSEIIACADAGCTYAPDWLARITAPIADATAEYALGGAEDGKANIAIPQAEVFAAMKRDLTTLRSHLAQAGL